VVGNKSLYLKHENITRLILREYPLYNQCHLWGDERRIGKFLLQDQTLWMISFHVVKNSNHISIYQFHWL